MAHRISATVVNIFRFKLLCAWKTFLTVTQHTLTRVYELVVGVGFFNCRQSLAVSLLPFIMLSCFSIRMTFWFWLYEVTQTAPDDQRIFFFHSRLSGNDEVTVLEVSWPDGSSLTRTLQPGEMNSVVEIAYPKEGERSVLANDTQVRRTDPRHELWTPVISQSVSVNGFLSVSKAPQFLSGCHWFSSGGSSFTTKYQLKTVVASDTDEN